LIPMGNFGFSAATSPSDLPASTAAQTPIAAGAALSAATAVVSFSTSSASLSPLSSSSSPTLTAASEGLAVDHKQSRLLTVPVTKTKLETRAVRERSTSENVANGITPTELLTPDTCTDRLRYTGVSVSTIRCKDGSPKVFLYLGVLWTELTNGLTEVEFDALQLPYYLPRDNFAFMICSLPEFADNVLKRAQGYFYWPRTQRYYQIPVKIQNDIHHAVSVFPKKS
jgi:hypothetical protein